MNKWPTHRFTTKSALVVLFFVSIFTISLINPSSTVSAKTFSQMSVTEQASAYVYYGALTSCAEKSQLSKHLLGNNSLTLPDAYNFNWFVPETLANPEASTALEKNGFIVTDKGLNLICGNDQSVSWIRDAITNPNYWGYTNGLDSVCEFGLKRIRNGDTEVDCKSGADTSGKSSETNDMLLSRNGDQKMDVNQMRSTLTNRMAPDNGSMSLTDPIKYALTYNAFKSACAGNEVATEGANNTYTIQYIDVSTGKVSKKTYSAAKPSDQKVAFYLGNGNTRETTTCGKLSGVLKDINLATEYSKEVAANLTDTNINHEQAPTGYVAAVTGDAKTCGGEVPVMGWIMCPMISGLSAMNDGMWGLVSSLLKTNPLSQSDSIYSAWGVVRNLANIAFVIVFMIIIFSQLSSVGVSNYGIKKLLPKLIVGAILVNLSFIIVQIAVDLANVIGSSLYDVLIGLLGKPNPPTYVGFFDLLLTGLAGGAGFAAATITIAGGATTLFWMMLPILLIAALGFLAAVFTLIFRSAAIPILAILAPLAFVAYLLPNTESWFKKWRDMFISMLMLYPLAALVFGGAVFASSAIMDKDNLNWFNYVMGLIILALPLFSLPFLATKGGAILGKVNGTLMGLANKAKSPIGKWAGANAERAKSRANNTAMNDNRLNSNGKPVNLRKRYLQRQARIGAIGQAQQSEFSRAQSGYIADQAESSASFRGKLAGGAGEAGQQRALAGAINTQNKLEADEVSAARVVFKHADLSGKDLQTLALGGAVTVAATGKTYSGDIMQRAAIEEKMGAGSMEEIHKIIEASGSNLNKFKGTISTGVITNKLSAKDPTLGGKRIDDISQGLIKNEADLDKSILEAVKQGKYNSEALASMDDKARERVIKIAKNEEKKGDSSYLDTLKDSAHGIRGLTDPNTGAIIVQASVELQTKVQGNQTATDQIDDLCL